MNTIINIIDIINELIINTILYDNTLIILSQLVTPWAPAYVAGVSTSALVALPKKGPRWVLTWIFSQGPHVITIHTTQSMFITDNN